MTAAPTPRADPGHARLQAARLLVLVGLVAGALSLFQTALHIFDSAYLISGLEDGSGHVQYHMARETCMNVGGFAVILLGLFAAPAHRTTLLWWIMLIWGLAYVAAMWGGLFVGGESVPGTAPLIVHSIASIGLAAGILLAKPAYATSVLGSAGSRRD